MTSGRLGPTAQNEDPVNPVLTGTALGVGVKEVKITGT